MSRHASKTTTTTPTAPASRVPVEFVTAREAATFLGLSLPTLVAMRHAGLGPAFVRVSPRRVVYPFEGLREYARARTITPTQG